ncbi:hypothetical protein DCS_01239 [Drechmeria coniospora]|uniref:Uncharacterized protein n=1 Tax=Drechmeria coniospora TaxID=98403 RepID=A0A151GSM6_DRECN|nr:hypothetical protein DCS_01239 [Drechmeria coniospora]KYK60105.1 hypothetical protein DCS_01239 [Drechmeria coniospora]
MTPDRWQPAEQDGYEVLETGGGGEDANRRSRNLRPLGSNKRQYLDLHSMCLDSPPLESLLPPDFQGHGGERQE